MKRYKIKEIYYTLQGEGYHSGRPAVFVRFTGCNLWSGREEDRAKAVCQFCDTDFVGTDGPEGGTYSAGELAAKVRRLWPDDREVFAVLTGGEPLLQLDEELIVAFRQKRIEVAIETNGSLPVPQGVDWVCVSPKAGAGLVVGKGDELKLVFPQKGLHPADFENLDFQYFFLQPMAGPDLEENTRLAVDYCRQHPRWRLSLQLHKILGID